MTMSRPIASLSLDVDNLWSYLKTHGDASWQSYPSYLDRLIPKLLRFFEARDQRLTFFVVGKDVTLPGHSALFADLCAAGHEIGNHSFHHEPWLHLYPLERLRQEIGAAEEVIESATGVRPIGFRGPGYSLSKSALAVLEERDYRYDCSTLPTYLGPLARWYYFRTSRLDREEKEQRARLFGRFAEGFRPLRAYRWRSDSGPGLLEIPVTTAPIIKTPIHCSYLLYLSRYSRTLATTYLRSAVKACRLLGVEPSLLLHPLDFVGGDEVSELAFFPGMDLSTAQKHERMTRFLDIFQGHFQVIPMRDHAERTLARQSLPLIEPRFAT